MGRAKGEVVFKDVSFRYVDDQPLIENFNLTVKPGQTVAIVGPTGAGKTTLVNLIMRFYEINSGQITLDGIDTSKLTRHCGACSILLPAPMIRDRKDWSINYCRVRHYWKPRFH